ncbi:MAG: tRNA (adenosine(37)-N6)-threonylcarbamoyltransferase complex transferase subunit TsaD [Armatimonadota bacterium]|nr:tRNA (adenosine(37)-N6)-threonylcarbamoyltransferase complex transferase subunit TsaD [Armatimonadota bacterium]
MALRPLKYFDGIVLGIETSCDETSVALMRGRDVLANVISSQADLHLKWGGVVPEAAARKHAEAMLPALQQALDEAQLSLANVSAIAVTNRPGLVGALSVGVSAAKALAFSLEVPLLGVDHLEGHVLSPAISADLTFPHVCLLVSGGHTELIGVHAPGKYERLGGTIDDAAGEAFDKSARALGLGYPGGPAIQNAATRGDSSRYKLPKGLSGETLDFSFSGLKTAVLYLFRDEGAKLNVSDAAASFEETITSVLSERAERACLGFGAQAATVVGGVAANVRLRSKLQDIADRRRIKFTAPPLTLCTDNAAMIAHAGSIRLAAGERDNFELDVLPTSNKIGK